MKKKVFYTVVFITGLIAGTKAQTITPVQYVEQYKDLAIREMKRMGVPAAITLAQGLLETESGNSELLKKSNNHFGIKCKDSWTSSGVSHDDDAPGECFRTYKDAEDSYRDHSNFLRGSERYAFLFSLDPADYKGWAQGLKKAGYATNPRYPDILIRNIEQYNLQQYSLVAVKDIPRVDRNKFEDDKPVNGSTQLSTETTAGENPADKAAALNNIQQVNGRKCVFAKKGTSLLLIATKHDIDLNKLLIFNDLDDDGILGKDQFIFLQKKSTNGENDFYIVKEKESLFDIAQKNGVQLQYLLDYNKITADRLMDPGTKILLKPLQEESPAKAVENITEPKPVISTKVHEVQPKEGLYAISKKYGVSIQQLRDLNNLVSDDLKIGQRLIITR